MTKDPKHAVRRANWNMNKRSFPTSSTAEPPFLPTARSLHADGDYERSLDAVGAATGWENHAGAWRLRGLCYFGLAQHEPDQARKVLLLQEARKQFTQSRGMHLRSVTDSDAGQHERVEVAKDDVNIAATFISEGLYDEAMRVAIAAKSSAPRLPTAYVAVLAILNRRGQNAELLEALRELLQSEAWLFTNADFIERLENDPDLLSVDDMIHDLRSAQP
jgi:tetratricopeptide (TPR) repeat protein